MKNRKTFLSIVCLSILLALLTNSCGSKKSIINPDEAKSIAEEVYIYGYPLITMEYTKRVMTNVEEAGTKLAPVGQFGRMRTYPSPEDKEVTAPNADTYYTLAWLDLSTEPVVLVKPDFGERFYLLPMLSGWTDVFSVPGSRTGGGAAKNYLITGPGWNGQIPEGLEEIKSPTAITWILGRIYCTGTTEDAQKVHALQDQMLLIPLSAYGKPYTPPKGTVDPSVDMKTPVREQVHSLSTVDYFKLLAKLLKNNPPAPGDSAIVTKMARLGIVPGEEFDASRLDTIIVNAINGVAKPAQEKIMSSLPEFGKIVNGWSFIPETGNYSTRYLFRALVTAIGLGANLPQDAIYPVATKDFAGEPLSGANKYMIHFEKGQTPPVKGFWSLTMYDEGYFFVPNEINRYTLSSRFDFKYNKDGSLDFYIQKNNPGKDKEANWLPSPEGGFILMFRFYWPDQPILDGSWKMPEIIKGK
jgi:hypothetical protein